MTYLHSYSSPLGKIILASEGTSLTGAWFFGQKFFLSGVGKENKEADLPIFEEAKRWLDAYFDGKNPGKIPSISFQGASPFQRRVWEILLTIPYGKTRTYGEIAREIEKETGKRASAQAVGGAVGHNPLSILVPCHRVMGANGQLTGYAGGIKRKIALLQREGNDVSLFRLPKAKGKKGKNGNNE